MGVIKARAAIPARLLLATVLVIFAAIVGIAGTPGSAGDTTADLVLGQLNFTSANPHRPSAVQLSGPWAAAIDTSVSPNRLFVADTANNRVLGFKSVSSLTNGQSADLVIGQPDYVSGAPNRGAATPTAASLNIPTG